MMSANGLEAATNTDSPVESTTNAPGAIPDSVTSPTAKLVYLYISTAGEATLSELQQTLGLKKIALFSVLDSLSDRDLVDCCGDQTYTAC